MNPELSIILPCRNEEKALGYVIDQIKKVVDDNKLDAEIIVSDSSTDRSPEIARKKKVKVVKHDKKGYGIAYLEGFKVAKGKYIIMGDSDGTYDFRNIPKFLKYLRKDYDLVIGNRFRGKIDKDAMPWVHKKVGNPMLSFILRLFYGSKINDAHCGLRGVRKKALNKLNLQTTGMEFASEMVIKAAKENLKTKELPINYHARKGSSTLNSFSDGWRHMRFMLMYAPDWLFFIPGIIIFIIGILIMMLFLFGSVTIAGITLQNRPMLLGSILTILGFQIIGLSLYTKTYMKSIGWIKKDYLVDLIAKNISFESGIIIGILLLILSTIAAINVIIQWTSKGFPALNGNTLILVFTIAIIGIQTIFSTFYISIMLVERK